jgi:hypothetical protein
VMPELTATQLAKAAANTRRAKSSPNLLVMSQMALKAIAARSPLGKHKCRTGWCIAVALAVVWPLRRNASTMRRFLIM